MCMLIEFTGQTEHDLYVKLSVLHLKPNYYSLFIPPTIFPVDMLTIGKNIEWSIFDFE